MTLIVSNTGPLLHLKEAQALDLLALTGEVHIPKNVEREISNLDPAWSHPAWLMVNDLMEPYAAKAISWQQAGWLHAGEAETLSLAQQLQADWFLTDDAAARLLAQNLGLEVHGSLGVVLWAAAVGHRSRADSEITLERLALSSLWLSPKILAEARTALDQLF
ncbi:MAG: hypothetical protein L6R45_23065 [Anaerolineae bacterium]|nr:hypothetical protein [Anaerolineae bacterium]